MAAEARVLPGSGGGLLLATSATAGAALIVAAGLSSGRGAALVAVAAMGLGGAGAYTIEVVDLFLLALFLFQWRDTLHGGTRHRIPGLAYCWIAMILLGLLDAITGPYRQLALVEAVQMAKSLALFLLLLGELTRVRRFMHLFASLCCGLLLQAAVGIAQYAKKGDIGLQFLGEATMTTLEYANRATYMDGGATFRIGGLLGHPNILAGFVAMGAPMLLALLMTRLPIGRKAAIGAVLAAALLALLLTLSRSGWLAFALAAPIVIGLMLRDRRSRRRALAGSLVALAFGLIAALAAAPAILRRFTQSDPGAVDFRWEWMGVAWDMVRDHPLLGVGLNSFVQHLPGRTAYGGTEALTRTFGANWPVVHDIYLLIWAEQGTIGFACFLLLLIGLLRTGWRNATRCADPWLHALNVGALAGLCANLLDGFGSFFLRQMPGARLFWIIAAIIVAIDVWQRRNSAERPA
ncbi:O-antigen ligase family protein (plasmid) [Sphingomonas bisphenolicum]